MAAELRPEWLALDDLGSACPATAGGAACEPGPLVSLLMRGQYDRCLRGCARAYNATTDLAKRHALVSIAVQALHEKGHTDAALQLFDRCYGVGATPRPLLALRARLHVAVGEAKAAVDMCKTALKAGKASADVALLDVLEAYALEVLPAAAAGVEDGYEAARAVVEMNYICFVGVDPSRVDRLRAEVKALAGRGAPKPRVKAPQKKQRAAVPPPDGAMTSSTAMPSAAVTQPLPPPTAPAVNPSPPPAPVLRPSGALYECIATVQTAWAQGDYATVSKAVVAALVLLLLLRKLFVRKQTITL